MERLPGPASRVPRTRLALTPPPRFAALAGSLGTVGRMRGFSRWDAVRLLLLVVGACAAAIGFVGILDLG